ncbi:MAG: histidine--tRNA ligase [Gemmatimonadetes bacterium]|nr:histidine--tRNA ligase [Gemmatimonadota bacterium]
MPVFRSLPGFRDFYPEEFAARAHMVGAWREASRRYGFEEYDGPPLEPLELYIEKSGEEIVRQLYNFQDKGSRAVALRPEMTPTLARMVGARARALRKPIRWFSVPQLFRYERAQRGRLREHFQWNVDVVGEEGVQADAEVLAVALDALRVLGLTQEDVVARVSDRRLLERLLLHAGVPADQLAATYAILDRLGREEEGRIREQLQTEAGLDRGAVSEIFGIFAHSSFRALAAAYAGVKGVAAQIDELATYFGALDEMGLGDYVAFDPRIVRGLAYYTGVVFEIFDRRGELRAVCGGGRYDQLLRAVSDADLPALGFGMGDVVLGEMLAKRGLLPSYAPRVEYYLVAVSDGERPLLLRLAHRLRDAGHTVAYMLRPAGVARQFKDADARGAIRVVVLGPAEAAQGVALVREMATGAERRVPMEELVEGQDHGG